MPETLWDETFNRTICIKMVTLLQLMFFELSEKLKHEKGGGYKMAKTSVLSSFVKEVRKHLRELRV